MREINEQSLEAAARAVMHRRIDPDIHATVTHADGSKSWVHSYDSELAVAAISAYLAAEAERGYALVHRDPTEAMHREGMATRKMQDNLNKAHHVIIDTSEIWRSMWDCAND